MSLIQHIKDSAANALDKFKTWCGSNTASAKCTRTIFQGLIGVIVANADLLLGYYVLDPSTRAILVAAVMAILSPIQASIGDIGKKKAE